MPAPTVPAIWQSVGMMVAAYGPGYWLISKNPEKYGAFVWIGIIGKTLGPAGFLLSALMGRLPWIFGLTLLFNDVIWWIPFWMFALKYAPLKSVLADEQSAPLVD